MCPPTPPAGRGMRKGCRPISGRPKPVTRPGQGLARWVSRTKAPAVAAFVAVRSWCRALAHCSGRCADAMQQPSSHAHPASGQAWGRVAVGGRLVACRSTPPWGNPCSAKRTAHPEIRFGAFLLRIAAPCFYVLQDSGQNAPGQSVLGRKPVPAPCLVCPILEMALCRP